MELQETKLKWIANVFVDNEELDCGDLSVDRSLSLLVLGSVVSGDIIEHEAYEQRIAQS